MIKTIKTGVLLVSVLLLAWQLPWFYTFLLASPARSPFTLYSCITHSFASISYDAEGKVVGRDFKGNTYTERQFDSILPMFYYRQLASEGRFPSQIEGVAVDVGDAERSGFIFRTSPSEINRRSPGLYQLLESRPARVDFKSPTDVFRITGDGFEFVVMETNTLDREKSDAFTRAMRDEGFAFPARVVAGNASTRKEYDNGYFIADNEFKVYHLKQVRGRPFVRRTDISPSLEIRRIFVTEFADRRLFGFLVDKDDRFYALETGDYSLHELPVGTFDPAQEGMMIVGDMFYWTVILQGLGTERLVAVNARDYSRVDAYAPESAPEAWERRAEYLFPFSLSFTSPLDGYVKPRLGDFSCLAFGLGALLAAAYAVLRRRMPPGKRLLRMAGIVLFGLFLFIPLLALESSAEA